MRNVRTVTLEFLRHGPPHNQLLSPLTEYLGLCGNFGAASVRVPYEHQEFLSRLRWLRYPEEQRGDVAQRNEVLNQTAVEMADTLREVPGLISGLCNGTMGKDTLTHLRIVLSAAELAMLPFELSKVPPGCAGGEGNWLSLQTVAPVSITRQVRTVSNEAVLWPRKPRILFVAASPLGLQVPLEQHTQALLKAILPWMKPFKPESPADLERAASEMLTILPNATIEAVEAACSKAAYTHVHILAHGMENPNLTGRPYGLALHSRSAKEKLDVVTGSRFAAALRPTLSIVGQDRLTEAASSPAVVTVASCDSGNVGNVIYNGASFAHELHQDGIPFVVASQFPLSKRGSIHMAEVLYEDLLWGEDPRVALHRLRGKLYALNATTHDWASLVAYAALPADLDEQLEDVRYWRARTAIDSGMAHLDAAIARMSKEKAVVVDNDKVIEILFDRIDQAMNRMPRTGGYETEGNGMLASTEKRKAEALHRASQKASDGQKAQFRARSLKLLESALHYYKEAYQENMIESHRIIRRKKSAHWVLCQYLSLRAILGEPFPREHWGAALTSAQVDLDLGDNPTRAWAHGTLAELYLLLTAYGEKDVPERHQVAKKKALTHAEQIVNIAGRESFPVYSTKRQFERYRDWWSDKSFEADLEDAGKKRHPGWSQKGGVRHLADQLARALS